MLEPEAGAGRRLHCGVRQCRDSDSRHGTLCGHWTVAQGTLGWSVIPAPADRERVLEIGKIRS